MRGHFLASLLFLGTFGTALVDSYCVEKGNMFFPSSISSISAEGKPSQSSLYHVYGGAANAIDGNHEGTFRMKSCVLTKSDFNPWWRLDLHQPRRIGAVVIANRKDCCWNRLKGAEVRIGNATLNQNPV
ncbi:F5/8 type C domain, partial [Pristimantis euphronides]